MILGLGLATTVGAASLPADRLRPSLVAVDTPDRYALWRAQHALPADEPVCEVAWTSTALLCYRVWEGDERRFVLSSDLAAWGATVADLHAIVARAAEAHLAQAVLVPVEGTPQSYLQLLDGDGWSAAGVLRPDLVVARLGGGPVRMAAPVQGALLAWRSEGADLDRIMAVGVKEIHDRGPQSVSPHVWEWNGKVWLPFGEAVPSTPGSQAPGSSPGN